ncbi:hypothetical protein GCM10023238_24650 [Streptomyces heliomycini]
MSTVNPQPLWQPSREQIAQARITTFQTWAAEHHGAPAEGGYAALHRWSVDELDTFWKAVTEWFDVHFSTPYARVLGDRTMPGAQWFPGATLNYAEHALRAAASRADEAALLYVDETHDPRPVTWAELRRQVGSLAAELRSLGVRPGDGSADTCRTSRRPSSPSSPRRPWAACGPPAQPTSAPAASSTASNRWNPSSCSPSTATATAERNTTAATSSPNCAANCPPLRAVVHIPLLGTEAPDGALDWSALTTADTEPVFEPVPFDTRCGCSTPPAPPDCPRRSSSPRAASSSSTSSSSGSTATWAPRTASSGTPPPAG